jgi:hypothetical protein
MLVAGAALTGGAWFAPAVVGIGLPAAAAQTSGPPGGGTVPPATTTSLGRVLVVVEDASGNLGLFAYEYDAGSWQEVAAGASLGGSADANGGADDVSLLGSAGVPMGLPSGDSIADFALAPGSSATTLTIGVATGSAYGLLEGIVATVVVDDVTYPGYTNSNGVDNAPPDVVATYDGDVLASLTFTAPTA